jgi:hypothetical protein
MAIGLGKQQGAHPTAAGGAVHRHPPQPSHPARLEKEPARAHHGRVLDRHQVERRRVEPVALGRRVHALLAAEHPLAQRECLRHLRLVPCRPDVEHYFR